MPLSDEALLTFASAESDRSAALDCGNPSVNHRSSGLFVSDARIPTGLLTRVFRILMKADFASASLRLRAAPAYRPRPLSPWSMLVAPPRFLELVVRVDATPGLGRDPRPTLHFQVDASGAHALNEDHSAWRSPNSNEPLALFDIAEDADLPAVLQAMHDVPEGYQAAYHEPALNP